MDNTCHSCRSPKKETRGNFNYNRNKENTSTSDDPHSDVDKNKNKKARLIQIEHCFGFKANTWDEGLSLIGRSSEKMNSK